MLAARVKFQLILTNIYGNEPYSLKVFMKVTARSLIILNSCEKKQCCVEYRSSCLDADRIDTKTNMI